MGLNEQDAGIFAHIKSLLDELSASILTVKDELSASILTVNKILEDMQGKWTTMKEMFDSWEEQIDAAQNKLEAEFPGYTRPAGWKER